MKKDLLVLMTVVAATSCTTVVDFDIPLNKPMVVVNSLFTPDSTWQVKVSYSNNILNDLDLPGSSFQPVANAVVIIRDQNDLVVDTLKGYYDRFHWYSYKGTTKPLAGQSYTVHVSMEDEPVLQAFSKVPTLVPITSVEIDSSRFIAEGEPIEMSIEFKDPGSEKNYYAIKISEETFYMAKDDTVWYTREVFFEDADQSLSFELDGADKLISDNLFNGKNCTLRLKVHGPRYYFGSQPQPTRNARVVLLCVTEEYFKYFSAKSLQQDTGQDPFAQPVQVFTNIENGLGIFAGYSTSVFRLK